MPQLSQAFAIPATPIHLDAATFDPWRIQPVTHCLSDHPLLQPGALQELGARLDARGSVRTHAATAQAGTPFGEAPGLHPNTKGAVATLADIANASAWLSLLNVQIDPVYRELVGSVLDAVQPTIEARDPGMCHRAGWIFVSSPRAVTPFHFDKEHNFILQMHGHKRVYVWDHRDTHVATEQARDRFHHRHERDLLRWNDEFRERAHVFDLGPGQGAYMPSTSPHLVENGDGPSITMSFTYYTRATRRDAMLHKLHELQRQLGMSPAPVGARPMMDAALHAGVSAALRARGLTRSLIGKPFSTAGLRYADVLE